MESNHLGGEKFKLGQSTRKSYLVGGLGPLKETLCRSTERTKKWKDLVFDY